MKVRFLGSGDAFGSGGRFNTCIMVEGAAGRYLVDCGATSHVAMRKFDVDPATIRAVFITHLHGDHFGGLPFLIMDGRYMSHRTAPLILAGPKGLRERLIPVMDGLFPGMSTA